MKTEKNLKYEFSIKILTAILILFTTDVRGQESYKEESIMFYNVENLFDALNDSTKNDEQFLPKGDKHWTHKRLIKKLSRISQVILSSGEGQLPVAIGLCEIENNNVLEMLLNKTPLGRLGYNYIHKESPDKRGIDVAFLYNRHSFRPITYKSINICSDEFKINTRDVLYVMGVIQTDTLHFFINHWPSKFGGAVETQKSRALVAKILKKEIDTIMSGDTPLKVIIMGDFNDSPMDESLSLHLGAKEPIKTPLPHELYNLSYCKAEKGFGSNKHSYQWVMLDQIIVSGSLLKKEGVHTNDNSFEVVSLPFLLEKDKTNLGIKPFRTYSGYKYNNGFSDHLPVKLKLFVTKD